MKKKFTLLACCLCSLLLAGCSDNDGPDNDGNGGGGGSSALTPTAQKQKLENIGTQFVSKINPDDQKEMIELFDYFISEFGDYSLEFQEEETNQGYGPEYIQRIVRKITRTVNGDMYALSQLGDPDSKIYQLADHYGIYTPDETTRKWVVTKADRIEINFKNAKNQTCLFKLTESGDIVSLPLDGEIVRIPEKLLLQISENGVQLAQLEVSPTIHINVPTASIRVLLETYGNQVQYRCESSSSFSDTIASTTYTLSKQSETLSTGSAVIHGTHLTAWLQPDEPESEIEENLNEAELSIDLLGQLQLRGSCSNVAAFVQIDQEMDPDSQTSVTEAATAINALLHINMYYDRTSTIQAKCIVDVVREEYPDYIYNNGQWIPQTLVEWYLEPAIQFTSDNSKYSFDSYFDQSGFGDLISRIKDLANGFENLLR